MRKIETLFVGAGLIAAIGVAGVLMWNTNARDTAVPVHSYPTTKYGAFLAAQHAIYVNDFDRAAEFTRELQDKDYAVVANTRMMSEFLSGRMPQQVVTLRDEKNAAAGLIYDAYLVQDAKWEDLYKRHKKDKSALSAPLRIWASVATNRAADAIKFIESLPTNASWKSFMRGQIYAQTGDVTHAADEFAAVSPDFMNINDYMYIMSFYNHNNMGDAADKLRAAFTMAPGGMYLQDSNSVPDWAQYVGNENALAFSLVQNVSHTQMMMYSDLSLLLMRFAQIVGSGYAADSDTINYYLGQYFYNNNGDFAKYFEQISESSPYYMFAVLRMADRDGDFRTLENAFNKNPLFIPVASRLIAHYVTDGKYHSALNITSRALENKKISDQGRVYFLKARAGIHYVFGNLDAAQADLHTVSDMNTVDADVLSLQAKIWAAQNRELENAYEYAMGVVRQNPTDVAAWDVLGRVVAAREGPVAALDLITRVGEVSDSCSALFEQLGDLYVLTGQKSLAQDAYNRAIALSDDGLTVRSNLEKKIRNLK
ncbi:hypothetical protein HDR61_02645 [bacterium]|nr:hypothetical protein [bacterium]